jgi:predicted nucleotidyltransferase component of viral defense system
MTEQLIREPEAVAALCARVAERIGIPADYVEKDFWVTEVLRGVVSAANENGLEIVFKGGTSLSKAFSLIHRFSEDVDMLAILPDALGDNPKTKLLKALVQGAAASTGLSPVTVPGATGSGAKRGARFHYKDQALTGGLSEGVFLEIGSRGGAMPANLMTVGSLLALHDPDTMNEFAEAQPVVVRVLSPCRTLVEKLVLLHTAHNSDDSEVARLGARHYYDVHQLLRNDSVIAELQFYGVEMLTRDVCTYSTKAGSAALGRPKGGFATSRAFTDSPHYAIVRKEYEQNVLGGLLWPTANKPSFEECLRTIKYFENQL